MKSNKAGSKQPDTGAKEKYGTQHGVTADKGNLNPSPQSQQSGKAGGSQQQQQQKQGERQEPQIDKGSQQQGYQSGSMQQGQSKSHGTRKLAADDDMDDDTGLSNRGNRQLADDIDEGSRQSQQSNVGRRDDGTPD